MTRTGQASRLRRQADGQFRPAARAAALALLVLAMPACAGPAVQAASAETPSEQTANGGEGSPGGTSAPSRPAAPASAAAAEKGIAILDTASSWDNLSELFLSASPAAPFSEGSVFVIRGNLRNDSGASVRYVVLRYELLDEKGNVVADAEGFNRRAESMRPDEEGVVHADKVEPLAAGAVDGYRMVFFHDEVPKFASRRVRVVEVHGGEAAGGAAK